MGYWLLKSDPDDFGLAELAAAPKKTTAWTGVRNYQARNFMRDGMKKGDQALLYHSTCEEPGIVGIVKIVREAYPDATQFDRKSKYHDDKATPDAPRWYNVDIQLERKTRLVSLPELRAHPELAGMRILQRGNRLSITPVDPKEWAFLQPLLLSSPELR
jgi:predicted RNA-binding protein with PUA-like domain